MSVKIIKRQYSSQFHDRQETVDWLLGNVGDWQRLVLTFQANVDFIASSSETVTINAVNNSFELNNGKNWADYGFDLGDEVTLEYGENNDGTETYYSLLFTIVNMYSNIMEVDEDIDFDVQIMPTDRGSYAIYDVEFKTSKIPEGLKFRHSMLTNSNYQDNNIKSVVDGTQTEFSFSGLGDIVTNQQVLMNPDGYQSGMAIERAYIKKISEVDTGFEATGSGGAGTFLEMKALDNGTFTVDNIFATFPLTMSSDNTQYKNVSQSYIPLNVVPSNTSNPRFANGELADVFLFNSQESGIKYFDISGVLGVGGVSENSPSDRIMIAFIKYTGGSNLIYDSRITINEYYNATPYKDSNISFGNIIGVDLDVGDSLALTFGYNTPARSVARTVYLKPRNIEVSVVSAIGDDNSNVFEVSLDYMLPIFCDIPTDLENRTTPKALQDGDSLTDNFEIEVYPEWNNPNTSIKNNTDHTERLGNTGWFDENFNGLDNKFKIESIGYYNDDGEALGSLDYAVPVIVDVLISGFDSIDSTNKFNFGFAWIPNNEEDYKFNKQSYHRNLIVNSGKMFQGASNTSFSIDEDSGNTVFLGYPRIDGDSEVRIDSQASDNVIFTKESDTTVRMRVRFLPNEDFTNFFDSRSSDDRNYVLWVSVDDADTQINFGNRVSLLADFNALEKTVLPIGEYNNMAVRFLEHPYTENSTGVDLYKGFLEDDVLARVDFTIDKDSDEFVNNVVYGYQVLNLDTGLPFVLERFFINTSNYPKVDGLQSFDVDTIRGFKLEDGNNKNWVKLFRNEDLDSDTSFGYTGYYANKIRWEDWIEKQDVPNEFFDLEKLNNGYNNNWLDYLRSGNYEIGFFVEIEVSKDGENYTYKNVFPIDFNGYDENTNIETEHFYYRNSNNTLLSTGVDSETGKPLGILLSNEETRIEILFTNLSEPMSVENLYGVMTIEVDKGPGLFEHRQLSSVWGSENDNILVPLQGETKLKIEQVDPNTVKISALVDHTKLTDAFRYKITGRLGCITDGNVINEEDGGYYEEYYEESYE